MLAIKQNLPLIARRGWTVEEFERLAEMGFFAPDEKLELIEGEIVAKMTQNPPHAIAVRLMDIALHRAFGQGFDIRCQLPLTLESGNRPEPDLAVVEGAPRDFLQSHPTSAVLVVEISDATLIQDREVKSGIYARAGIAEYWIVNLVERVVEVRREPQVDETQPLGFGYKRLARLSESETLAPLSEPQNAIAVADLLP